MTSWEIGQDLIAIFLIVRVFLEDQDKYKTQEALEEAEIYLQVYPDDKELRKFRQVAYDLIRQ